MNNNIYTYNQDRNSSIFIYLTPVIAWSGLLVVILMYHINSNAIGSSMIANYWVAYKSFILLLILFYMFGFVYIVNSCFGSWVKITIYPDCIRLTERTFKDHIRYKENLQRILFVRKIGFILYGKNPETRDYPISIDFQKDFSNLYSQINKFASRNNIPYREQDENEVDLKKFNVKFSLVRKYGRS